MKTQEQTFTNKFIAQGIEEAAWKELSSDNETYFKWDEELIAKYIDKWDWDELSENGSVIWTSKMLDRFDSYINWSKLTSSLFCGRWNGLKFEKLHIDSLISYIEKHEEKWDWKEISEEIEILDIEKFIDRFSNRIMWQQLANNRNIMWTVELFNKYESQLSSVEDIKESCMWRSLARSRANTIFSQILTEKE
ncbi:MAG: hypothetical protein R3Y51_07955 [Rikenellaceae bacterium]